MTAWNHQTDLLDDADDVTFSRSRRIVTLVAVFFCIAAAWAYFATLDEVASGTGRVVPTTREQVIQSLEGGILSSLHVRQDDVVEAGQLLAQLDPKQSRSNVEESAARYRAAMASAARLSAEVNRTELSFPSELDAFPHLMRAERELFEARRSSLNDALRWVRESTELVQSELSINEDLSTIGAASTVEVLRLRRQLVELELQQVELRSEYIVRSREELSKANAEVSALRPVVEGRNDTLSRLTHRSPVRGIVKNIEVSTVGGVVPPNGVLMEIVPLDDQLLIEARVSPRDIAFIHPGQAANVKITAYDYAIFGGLEGYVSSISPDTIRDEIDPNIFYYRVFVRTASDALVNTEGQSFAIVPGMIATADIRTGTKSVLRYLLKPLNRASEALRER
ncbi:HlyD family efflux transporter periplasmic adaptor subunit [Aureimonas fodinaquatilis]|uniref:HlyD family efflux transporter periplasmic adaptor subunit n=1 Tax=Aureimonas fodinaquatilis TaxID=2565783 RepID=A0A5B0DVZ8_9HYPH|nr:HlyD family efflux transporter periplasmic adaptor subunit [Aureimonas fodinaquatilis]KAA0970603.1 HlyD family efflux transporter periplasmic adaptor subunit [Aureimonas fodinaquatilis]